MRKPLPCLVCGGIPSEQYMYRLRRIGLPPSVECVKNEFRFDGDTMLVGRGGSVDIFLDSSIRKGLISRAHAQIIRKRVNNKDVFELFDTSLNGTYINDMRIKGSQILKEGDTVTFGHLRGSLIQQGEIAPQKETEFLFKFERYIKDEVLDITDSKLLQVSDSKSSVFMSPKSPNAPELMILPGLPATFTTESEDSRKRKFSSCKINGQIQRNHDSDMDMLISTVTQKIKSNDTGEEKHEDSFDLDIDIPPAKKVPPSDSQSLPIKPVHPRDKLLSNTIPYANSPLSFASSDSEIKHDTSLNVKHLDISDDDHEDDFQKNEEEEDEESEVTIIEDKSTKKKINEKTNTSKRKNNTVNSKLRKNNTVNFKLRKVLQNFGKKPRRKEIESETESDTFDSESTLSSEEFLEMTSESDSEKSEEITDRSSDSDFAPIVGTVKLSTRTRNINSPEKLQVSRSKKQSYVHDECAAWDCKRPSGAIKKITWVQCDDCDAWYHLSCSGLKTKDAKREDTNFHCGC